MGPVGQDFHAAFGLGADELHISSLDADGVALAAVQGLYQQTLAQQEQIQAQDARIEALEAENARIEALEAQVAALVERLSALAAQRAGEGQ
jgi:hypothetical protein